jgi:hypothetical protein
MLVIFKGSFFSLSETFDSVSLDSGLDFELERADDDDHVVDDGDDFKQISPCLACSI